MRSRANPWWNPECRVRTEPLIGFMFILDKCYALPEVLVKWNQVWLKENGYTGERPIAHITVTFNEGKLKDMFKL